MTGRSEEYRNRRGESVSADEALTADGVLRDGFGLRAPLLMLDSVQQAIATDARKDDTASTFVDSRGIEFVDHRIADTARALERLAGRDQALRAMWRDGRQAANEARAEMIRDMCAGNYGALRSRC